MNTIGSQNPVVWAKKLENASKTGTFYTSIDNEYRKLSIKEINTISQEILTQNHLNPLVSIEIKMYLRLLIKIESANLTKTAEKTNSWWMNALIYISFATILFIPLGKYLQNKQAEAINQAKEEIKDLATIKESITLNKDEKAIKKQCHNKRSEFQKLKAERLNSEIENFKGDKESDAYVVLLKQQNEAVLKAMALSETKKIKAQKSTKLTKGINNGGNTCYINSALQPLLAVKGFSSLMPDQLKKLEKESDEQYANRSEVFERLKTFLDAWQSGDADDSELMKLVNSWRSAIYKAVPFANGKESEASMQSSGIIFDKVLEMIEQTHAMELVKSYPCPDDSVYNVNSVNPAGILSLLLQSGSVQERIEEFARVEHGTLEIPLEHEIFKNLTEFTESSKIVDKPKDLLILDLGYHNVDAVADLYIDASSLFKDNVLGKANYKLVGFSQNIGQYHWTSVVLKDDAWQCCNDETVYKIDSASSTFKHPANYMVYQKI